MDTSYRELNCSPNKPLLFSSQHVIAIPRELDQVYVTLSLDDASAWRTLQEIVVINVTKVTTDFQSVEVRFFLIQYENKLGAVTLS